MAVITTEKKGGSVRLELLGFESLHQNPRVSGRFQRDLSMVMKSLATFSWIAGRAYAERRADPAIVKRMYSMVPQANKLGDSSLRYITRRRENKHNRLSPASSPTKRLGSRHYPKLESESHCPKLESGGRYP